MSEYLIVMSLLLVLSLFAFSLWRLILLLIVRRDQRVVLDSLQRLQRDVEALKHGKTGEMSAPRRAAMPAAPPPLPSMPAAAPPAAPPPLPVGSVAGVSSAAAAAPCSAAAPLAGTDSAILPPAAQSRRKNRLEIAVADTLRKIWNWIIVGEEYRPAGVSVEYAVATNWLVRIGIVILVTGIGFGLRLSMEKGWLGPEGRVALGLLAGAGLTAGGLKLLGKRYHLLGQGLIGGGLATLYFSTFAAHQLYGLIPALVSFGFMALVTVGAGVIAVIVNSLLIAILGIIGGYATPFVLTGSEAGYASFFCYLLLLGIGILGIAHRRNWHLLNSLGLVFTYSHVILTLFRHYRSDQFWQVMPFLGAFFALYSALVVYYNLVHRRRSTLLELAGLLANSGLFFWLGGYLVDQAYGQPRVAVLTLLLAGFYIVLIRVFLQRGLVDRLLLLFLVALAAFYVSLTLPLLLSAQWLTVSWALQAFLVLWLSKKLDSPFIRYISYILYVIVLGRLLFLDLGTAFPRGAPVPSAAQYFQDLLGRLLAFGIPIASLAGAYWLQSRRIERAELHIEPENDLRDILPAGRVVWIFVGVAVAVCFLYLNVELNRMFQALYEPLRLPMLTLLWVLLAVMLLNLDRSVTLPRWLTVLTWLVLIAVVLKVLGIDLRSWELLPGRWRYGGAVYSWRDGAMRLLDFGLLIGLLLWAAAAAGGRQEAGRRTYGIAALALLFLFSSLELNTFLGIFVPGLRPGGISILWSAFALGGVVQGIRADSRLLRFSGLALFAVVALKVYFSDLSHLSPVYRMIALVILGLVLLCGSFIYLKNLDAFRTASSEPSAADNERD